MSLPIQHPDVLTLREACKRLRLELSDVITEWHRLSSVERPHLLALYDLQFGSLEAKRQSIVFQSAKLFRKIELLSVKIARGEKLTAEIVALVKTIVDKEFERIAKSEQRVASANGGIASANGGITSANQNEMNGELVPLYRTLAKKLHPDAVGEDPELRELWERAQSAYLEKDIRQLRNLMEVLIDDGDNDVVTDAWTFERWHEEERRLSSRVKMEKRKLDRLRNEEPFSIADEIVNDQWVEQHRSDLELEITSQTDVFVERQKLYNELTTGLTEKAEENITSNGKSTFDDDFMQNTYFSGR